MSELDRALALQAQARAKLAVKQQPNPDGTYGQPPEGFFPNPETGQMTSRDLLRQNMPTSRAGAAASGYMQGFSMDSADEIVGAGSDIQREKARAQMEANAQDYPVTETVGRIAGAVTSPVNKVLGPVKGFKAAMGAGGVYGAGEGFFSGEGDVFERLKSAGWGAGTGALFGGLTERVGRGANKAVRAAFTRADKRPTIETLKGAKNAAYQAVRKSGEAFDANDMQALWQRVERKARTTRWEVDPELDKAAVSTLKSLEARKGQPMTLNQLDRYRQRVWDLYDRYDEPFLLEVIGEIDNTISNKANGSELMAAARDANAKYSKARLLESAFRKARLQTASTGSGGNILNKYRQAITRIVTNPKEAKWFSPEEIALMERFVEGDDVENVLRRVGKLAPGGNGLMTALTAYAAAVDPTTLVIGGTGALAKEAADRSAMQGSERILDSVSTGIIPTPAPKPDLKPLAVGGAALGNSLR